jgi:hypothetical protein
MRLMSLEVCAPVARAVLFRHETGLLAWLIPLRQRPHYPSLSQVVQRCLERERRHQAASTTERRVPSG